MTTTFNRFDLSKILFDSFCNGGLNELYHSSVLINWDEMPNHQNYSDAKSRLKIKKDNGTIKSICYEDVLWEILDNGDALVFTDVEGEEQHELTLDSAFEKINNLSEENKMELVKVLKNEDDCDGWTYYNALQLCLYGDVIFG